MPGTTHASPISEDAAEAADHTGRAFALPPFGRIIKIELKTGDDR
jgi:hypothetical protein